MAEHTPENVARVLTVPTEDAMFDFLSALNVSGLHPEVACTLPSGGMSFLAGLTEPDADHVHITVTESDTGVVHCCECSHPGERPNQWDPNLWEPIYPVLALVVQWPDADRVAQEDYLDPWWTRVTVGQRDQKLADYLAAMDRAGGGVYTRDFREGFRHALTMMAAYESNDDRAPVREAARNALARSDVLPADEGA